MINLQIYTNRRRISAKLLVAFSFILVALAGSSVLAEGAAGSLFFFPSSESFGKGSEFSVQIKTDTGDTAINAAQATIYFPSDKLEVLNISKADSIFTLWTEEPTFSNFDGKIQFGGGLPTPGFNGIGNLITVNFRAKAEGIAIFNLTEGKVLADDGKGTDILVFSKEAKYYIQKTIAPLAGESETLPGHVPSAPQIFSSTHPQSEEWYNNNNPRFQWGLTPQITGLSFVLDQNPGTRPDAQSEGLLQSKSYEGISDGVWYFHLALANETGWGETSHYRLQIDTRAPSPFEITIDNAGDPTNPSPALYFETEDDVSGIKDYKIKMNGGNFSELMLAQVNPFSMPHLLPGRHLITIRAADQAGNNVDTKAIIDVEPIKSPQITLSPGIYVPGEEILYIEGTSLPETEVIIYLKKDNQEIKRWQTSSNASGEWSFSTKDLIKSGTYYLSAQTRDKRGAVSNFSEDHKIEVSFSGIVLGTLLFPFKKLIIVLSSILALGIIAIGYFVYRTRKTKKILKKETKDIKETLYNVFDNLKKEIDRKIEMFDSQPGFSEKEREVCDELRKTLDDSEKRMSKEIKDVEKELE